MDVWFALVPGERKSKGKKSDKRGFAFGFYVEPRSVYYMWLLRGS